MQIETIEIAALNPSATNSRTHSKEQILQIAASINEFGFTNPVLIDDSNGIIAGHGRVMAAREIGLDSVPCIRLSHLTEIQRRAYIIADNKLALNAGWDDELLRIELKGLEELGFDLELTGFTLEELEELEDLQIEESEVTESSGAGSLSGRFMLPPFSVLNAREGWWQDRKRGWLALGIKSELGRGENGSAAPGRSVMCAGYSADGERLVGLKNIKNGKGKAIT